MEDQNQECNTKKLLWTLFEKQFTSFQSSQCENATNMYRAITQKMEKSSLNIFLYHLNTSQKQENLIQKDKLERLQFDVKNGLEDIKELEQFNNICDDLVELIELYLYKTASGTVTVKEVLKRMKILRMTGSKIRQMDRSLSHLQDLDALVLAGNCLTLCEGGRLPRGLKILELCSNRVDVTSLAEDPPPHLLYLGLARNNLPSGVMESMAKFEFLYHLDLGNNDLDDLSLLMEACSQMQHLSSLILIGNPCSMSPNYLQYIVKKLPKLIFLDGELLKERESIEEEVELRITGRLQINLFRVMEIPQPQNIKVNKKKVTHSFRLELDAPLLQSYLENRANSFIIGDSLPQNEEGKESDKNKKNKDQSKTKENVSEKENANSKKGKKKTSGSVASKENKSPDKENAKSKKGKKKTSGSVASKENKSSDKANEAEKETSKAKKDKGNISIKDVKNSTIIDDKNEEVEIYQSQMCSDKSSDQVFKSERKSWAKIIEFGEPTIEVSNCDLLSLRDVFRTELTLRVVHLMTLPPVAKAKKKPKKQGKDNLEEKAICEEETNKEILISKSTLAKIKIPLQDIIWNKKYLEYVWTINKPFVVEPSNDLKIKTLLYGLNPAKNKKEDTKDVSLPIPSGMTCHIGVGVERQEDKDCVEITEKMQ